MVDLGEEVDSSGYHVNFRARELVRGRLVGRGGARRAMEGLVFITVVETRSAGLDGLRRTYKTRVHVHTQAVRYRL